MYSVSGEGEGGVGKSVEPQLPINFENLKNPVKNNNLETRNTNINSPTVYLKIPVAWVAADWEHKVNQKSCHIFVQLTVKMMQQYRTRHLQKSCPVFFRKVG